MNLLEIKSRIEVLDRQDAAVDRAEFESFCTGLIEQLPRDGQAARELRWAYEQVIELRLEEHRPARAARVFKQYVADGAPPCDDDYDQTYYAGLLATGTALTPLRRRDRFYSLVQLFRRTLNLQGLMAECGCYRGLSSYVLCSTLRQTQGAFNGEGFRIFDSFAGLSVPQAEDQVDGVSVEANILRDMTRPGKFAAALEQVQGALAAFPHIRYFPGWIPQGFPPEPDARYRFVHVDVDIYQPTRDSFEYFYPRLVPGGIIVSDDYNWPGARKALAEFCDKHGATLELTPYTQAYVVRRD